jgi:glycosyltransferase involved in cell wall biosynthesis
MFCSVIISTYNSPVWLEKAVWGYAAQSFENFEVVIADDGSSSETAMLIARLRRQTGLDIQHVWHNDRGFRKCRILNRAISVARGSYLIFSDGDCIPRRDFVERHYRLAKGGCFLSGGMLRLPRQLSEEISVDNILSGQAFQFRWLRERQMPLTHKLRHLITSPRWAWWLDLLTTTRATFNGHNSSAWREDILRVNGFDERMGYGGLDRELGERLMNLGIRPKQVRHATACMHLDHDRGYVNAEALAFNKRLRRQNQLARVTWTDFGIVQESQATPTIERAKYRWAA